MIHSVRIMVIEFVPITEIVVACSRRCQRGRRQSRV